MRASGFRSVNLDLIYGLPKQTLDSFNVTLDRVLALDPDRIALYNYAHLPSLFKPQRRIQEADLPAPETKLQILTLAIGRRIASFSVSPVNSPLSSTSVTYRRALEMEAPTRPASLRCSPTMS